MPSFYPGPYLESIKHRPKINAEKATGVLVAFSALFPDPLPPMGWLY
jgi:hypothetical protein